MGVVVRFVGEEASQSAATEEQVAERHAKVERALSVARDFINRVISSSQRGSDELPLEIANDALETKQKVMRILQ